MLALTRMNSHLSKSKTIKRARTQSNKCRWQLIISIMLHQVSHQSANPHWSNNLSNLEKITWLVLLAIMTLTNSDVKVTELCSNKSTIDIWLRKLLRNKHSQVLVHIVQIDRCKVTLSCKLAWTRSVATNTGRPRKRQGYRKNTKNNYRTNRHVSSSRWYGQALIGVESSCLTRCSTRSCRNQQDISNTISLRWLSYLRYRSSSLCSKWIVVHRDCHHEWQALLVRIEGTKFRNFSIRVLMTPSTETAKTKAVRRDVISNGRRNTPLCYRSKWLTRRIPTWDITSKRSCFRRSSKRTNYHLHINQANIPNSRNTHKFK